MSQFQRVALPVLSAAVLVAAVFWPLVRFRLRVGVWPIGRHGVRPAVQRWVGAALALSVVGAIAWCVCVALVDADRLAVWEVPAAVHWTGALLGLMGVTIVALAQAQMGVSWRMGIDARPTPLVSSGLFRFTRNPIYSGWAAIVAGALLLTPSPWTIMGLVWVVSLLGTQARLEEHYLLSVHGHEYAAYAARVGRFLPRVGRLRNADK